MKWKKKHEKSSLLKMIQEKRNEMEKETSEIFTIENAPD